MTDPILEYKQKPLEGYGTSNENLINIVPYNDLFGKLGALSDTPAPANLQMPDLSKLLTQPQIPGPLAKLDLGYQDPTDNLWAKSTETLRQKNPDLFNPVHRVTALPGSFIKEYTNTDSNYDNMFTRAAGQFSKAAIVGGAVGGTIGAGVSAPLGGVGAIPGWGIGAIVAGVGSLLGLMETSGKQGFKFNVNNQEETSQKQSGFFNTLGGFTNNVVDRSFEASVGGTAALLATPFGAMAGKDFYNMGENPLSSYLANSLEESEFKMKLSNNYLNKGPIAKFFTREGFSNDIADMVGFTVGMIAGTKMQGGANLFAGKIAGLGAEALGFTESAAKMSTVGLLRSPSGFLLGRNTTLANQAGLTATKGLSAITTGKNIALAADELIPMFKSGFGGGIKQLATGIYSKGLKAGVSDVFSNYGTKLTNIFKDGSVGLSYLKNFERTALASYGEARVEGLQTYQNVYDSAIKNGYTPEQAIEKATKAANKALFGNMVLLGITNQVALNNLIESPSRLKSLTKWFDDAWKYDGSTRNILKNALSLKGDSLLRNVGKNFIIEGFAEELGQHAISEGAKNYIMNKNNPIHQSYWEEFIDAYREGLSSDEGISNWFGGGLFGAAMGLGGGGLSLMRDKKAAKAYSLDPSFLQRVSKFETATEFFANHMSPYNGQLYSTYSETEINGQKVYQEDIDGDLRFVDDPTRIVKLYQALSHINRLGEDQSKVLTAPIISNIANLNENDPMYAEHKEAIESVREYFDYLDLSEKIYSGQSDAFMSSKQDIEEQIAEINGHLSNKSLDPVIESNLTTSKEQLQEQLDNINQHLTKINSSKSMVEASKKEAPKSIADYAEANEFKKTSIMKGLQLLHNTSQELNDVFSFKHDLEPLYIDLVKTNHVADYVTRGVEEKLFAELDAFEKDLTTSDNLTFMGSTFKNKEEARAKISEFKDSLEEQVDLYKKILFRYGNPVTTAILKNKDGKNFKHNVYVDTKALLRSAVAQRHLSDKYRKNEELKNNIQLETILNNPELYQKYLDPKFTYDDLLKDIDKGIFNVKIKTKIEDYLPEVKEKLNNIQEEYEKQQTLLENNPNDPAIIAEISRLQDEYNQIQQDNKKEKQEVEIDDFKATRAITDPIEVSFKQLKTYQKNQQDIQDMLDKENELYLRHTNIDWIVNQAQQHELIYKEQAADTKSKAPETKVETSKKDDTPVEKKSKDPEVDENLPIEENVKSETTDINKERYDKILEVYNNLQQEISDEEGLTGDDLIIATDNEMSLAYPDDFAFKVLYEKIQKEIEELRAKEQAELDEKIPNAEQYRVNGRVDKNKLTNDEDIAAYNKIYEVYNKLITDLTKQLTPDTTVTPNQSDIEAKKADIEKRRQKSLTTFTYKDLKGSDMTIAESVISYADGTTEIVSDILDVTNKDSHWRLKQTINTKYDAEYVDAVNKGEMTKEQAMQALEEIGRKNSAAYTELNTLKESTQTIPTFIISKKYVINGVVATFKSLNKEGTYTFIKEKGGNISENRPEILSSIVEYIPSQTSQTIKEDVFVDDITSEQEEIEKEEIRKNPNKNPRVPLTLENLYKSFGNESEDKVVAGKKQGSIAHKAFRSFLSSPNGLEKFSNAKLFAIPLNHPITQTIFDEADKEYYKDKGLPIGGQVIYIYVSDNNVITYNGKNFELSNITTSDLLTRMDLGDLTNIPYDKSIGYTVNEKGQIKSDKDLYTVLTKVYAQPKGMSDLIYSNPSTYIDYIKNNGLYKAITDHLNHINKLISVFNDKDIDIINKIPFLSLEITGIGKGVKIKEAPYVKLTSNGELLQSTLRRPLKENGKELAKNAFYFKIGNNYHLTFRKTLASVFQQTQKDLTNPFNKEHLHTVITSLLTGLNNDNTDNPLFLHNDLRFYLKSLLGISILDYKGINFDIPAYMDNDGKFDLSKITYPDSNLKINPETFKNNRFTFAVDGDMRFVAYYGKNIIGYLKPSKSFNSLEDIKSNNLELAKFVDNMLEQIVSKPIPINLSRLNQSNIGKQRGQLNASIIEIPIINDGKIVTEIDKNGDVLINSLKINYKKLIVENEIVTYLPSQFTKASGEKVNSRLNRYPLYKSNTFVETSINESTSENKNEDINELIRQKKEEIKATTDIVKKNKLKDELKNLKEKLGSSIDNNGFRISFSKYSDIENIPEFITWLESVLPQFTVQTSLNKINGIAQGQYIKNLIKIWEGAQSGTGFHEAFEAVWFNMLSPKEQSDLINEFKDREGSFRYFVDGRTINYKDATNLEAKEMLAEGFREFMLVGKQSKPKAQGFFNKLLDLLKSFINNVRAIFGSTSNANLFIEDIYQKIADGDFKNFTINNYSKETGYRMDYGDEVMSFIMNGVMKSVHSNVMDNVRQNLSLNVYDIVESNNKKELSKKLEDIINTSFEKITDAFAEYCAVRTDNEYDIYYKLDEDGLVVFNPEFKDKLKQDYIDFYFKDTFLYDKSDYEEYAEENRKTREGIKEDTEIDPLSKVRPVISFILSNLRYIDNKGNFEKSSSLRTKNEKGEYFERVFVYKTPNLDTVKSLLVSNLKDIVAHKKFVEITEEEYDKENPTHRIRINPNTNLDSYYKLQDFDLFTQYISKIDEIIKKDPRRFSYLNDLKSQLKFDVDYNLLSESDKQLRVSFVASFNLTGFTPVNYSISSRGNDINDIMYDEAANKMIGNWKLYAKLILEQSLLSEKSSLFVEEENPFEAYDRGNLFSENREIFLDLNKFRAYYNTLKSTDKNKVMALQSIGIIFSEENLYDDSETLQNIKLTEEIDNIINILVKGEEEKLSLDTFFREYVGTSLRTLASTVGNIEGAANLSFLGPNNEMQYTVINPSTESYIINKLNSVNSWDELVHNFPFMFQEDGNLKPGVQNNLFLKKGGLLFDSNGIRNTNKFERVLVSGLKDRDKNTGEKFSSASILSQRVVGMSALLDGIFSGGINADKSMENAYKLIGKTSKITEGLLSHDEVLPILNYMTSNKISHVLPMYKSQVIDEIFSYFNRDKKIKTIKNLDGLLVFKDRLPTLHKMIVDKVITVPNDPKIKEYFNKKGEFGFENELKKYLETKNDELYEELVDTKQNIYNYTTKFSLDTLVNVFSPNIKIIYDENGDKTVEKNPYFNDIGGNVFQLTINGVESIARLINGLNDLIVNDFVKMKSGDFSALVANDHPKRANAPTSSKIGRDLSKNVLETLDEIMPATVGKHRAKLNFISLKDTIVSSANLTNRMEKLYKLSSQILKDRYGDPMSDDKIFKMLGATFTNGKLSSDLDIKGSVYHTYKNLDMADAQAWCLPKLYSNLFFSSGMLSQEKKRQLQYEMAVERQERSLISDPELRYFYTDDKLKTMDENILLNEEMYNTGAILEVIKPFGYGFHRDSNLVSGILLKNSMALLTWNRVKNNPTLAKQYVAWQNADIDVIGHESGQKQGVLYLNEEEELHPLFNEDGTRNTTVPDGYMQSIEGEHFGFQVEMHDSLKEESTLGSQLSNIIIGDLKGFLDDNTNTFLSKKDKERISKNIEDYLDIQRGLVFTGRQKALDKLGLKEVYTNGVVTGYINNDPKQLAKTLEESAKTLKVPINTMDLFKLVDGKFQYYFETASKSDSIEYILNSIIDKAAIHQKVKGTQAPQVSSEMVRNEANWKDFVYVDNNGIYSHFKSEKLFKAFKGKKFQTSSALRLLDKDEEVINPDGSKRIRKAGTLEVMMPSFMKGKVNIGLLDPRLLEFVGYRIPTQSLGQIEAIEVVDFLDDTWGNAIIVPSEIVGKAGSDFDIDKLNMYMPHFSVTTDENGDNIYTYIEYDEDPSEEGILRRYEKFIFPKIGKIYREKMNEWFTEVKNSNKNLNDLYKNINSNSKIDSIYFKDLPSGYKQIYYDNEKKFKDAELEGFVKINNYKALTSDLIQQLENLKKKSLEDFKALVALKGMLSEYQDNSKISDELMTQFLELRKEYLEIKKDFQDNKGLLKDAIIEDFGFMSLETFKNLPIYSQNTREQLENRNIQLIRSLTLEPINQLRHLMPNGSKNLKEYSNDINKDKKTVKANFSDLFTFMGRTKARYIVINAKSLVGMGATNIPTHCIAQNGQLILNEDNVNSDILNNMTKDEGIALYNILDKNGYLISSTLSEFLSAFVDGAKDPFIMDLNVTNETVSRLLLLIRLGVTPEIALRFINQPILKEYAIVLQNSKDLTNKYMSRKYDLRSLSKEHKAIYNFFMDNMNLINTLKTNENSLSNEFYNYVQWFITNVNTVQRGGTRIDPTTNSYIRNEEEINQAFKNLNQSLNQYDIINGKKLYTGKGILGTLKSKTSEFWKLLNLEYDTNPKSLFNLATLDQYSKDPKNQIQTMKYLQFQVGLLYEFKDLNKTAILLGEVNSILNAHSKAPKTLREIQIMISKMEELRDNDIKTSASIFNIRQALRNSNQESVYEVRQDTFKMLAESKYLLTASPAFVKFIEEKMKDSELTYMTSGDLTKYMSTYSNFALSYMIHNYSSFNDKITDMENHMFKESVVSKINYFKSEKNLYNKFKNVFDNLSFNTSELNEKITINNISLYNPKQTVDNRNEEIIKYEDAYKMATQMKLNPINLKEQNYAKEMIDMLELLCNFSIYQHGLINTMSSYQDTLPSGLYSKTVHSYLEELEHLFFIDKNDKNIFITDKPIIDKLFAQNFYYNGLYIKYADKPLSVSKQGKYVTSFFKGTMTLFKEVDFIDSEEADMLSEGNDDLFNALLNYKYRPIEILGNRGKYIVFTENNLSSRMNTSNFKGRSFISKEYDEDELDAREQALINSSTQQEITPIDDDLAAREEAMQSSQYDEFEIVEDINPFMDRGNEIISISEIASIKPDESNNKSNFNGYKGGFENIGKGSPQGDGKDKAMREVADGFIGRLKNSFNGKTSSNTSYTEIGDRNGGRFTSYGIPHVNLENAKVVMLASNKEFNDEELTQPIKDLILRAKNNNAEFVVGDMPGVDSQFIDYLQEIGAKFTIYHTGVKSRIEINKDESGAKDAICP